MGSGTIALLILVAAGAAILSVIRSARTAKANRLQLQRSLGLTPVQPTAELTGRVNDLYRRTRRQVGSKAGTYALRNVSGKSLSNGALFVLDVVETSGSDHDLTENQGVLIASPDLELPAFAIFPRADVDGTLPSFANRLIDWVVSKWGDPVPFPEAPEFERRYVVSSPEADATRAFLDDYLLGRLAETRLLTLQAAGDTFIAARLDLKRAPLFAQMEERVNEALTLFALFRSRSLERR
jgi:hypothetical protein